MRDNVILIGLFATGILFGAYDLLPKVVSSLELNMPLLYLLMFTVGISIGNDTKSLKRFRELPRHLLLLPFLTIAGSLLGGIVVAIVMQEPLPVTLAIASGQGYYSLSALLLSEQVGATVGAIALLANISRELFTILLMPLLRRWFGPYAPISAGGATTMDITLPFILRYSGKRYLAPSLYHGLVCDLSVPLLVTLFSSLT